MHKADELVPLVHYADKAQATAVHGRPVSSHQMVLLRSSSRSVRHLGHVVTLRRMLGKKALLVQQISTQAMRVHSVGIPGSHAYHQVI